MAGGLQVFRAAGSTRPDHEEAGLVDGEAAVGLEGLDEAGGFEVGEFILSPAGFFGGGADGFDAASLTRNRMAQVGFL